MSDVEITQKQMLVLDIDGTLIDSCSVERASEEGLWPFVQAADDTDCVFARPHLDEFIAYCFDRFEHVALWTLGSVGWADFFVGKVLKRKHDDFAFVWAQGEGREGTADVPKNSINRATRVYASSRSGAKLLGVGFNSFEGGMYKQVKELKKIWRNRAFQRQGWTKWNTLIVEDTPSNCCRNFGNAIYVPTFSIDDEMAERISANTGEGGEVGMATGIAVGATVEVESRGRWHSCTVTAVLRSTPVQGNAKTKGIAEWEGEAAVRVRVRVRRHADGKEATASWEKVRLCGTDKGVDSGLGNTPPPAPAPAPASDDCLLRLRLYLQGTEVRTCSNVRSLEKRHWYLHTHTHTHTHMHTHTHAADGGVGGNGGTGPA